MQIVRNFLVMMAAGLALASSAKAQLPETFENLKVLPQDISQQELIGYMRSFAIGLGVRCQHCHVGEEGQPLSTFDFASDTKAPKSTARIMLGMTEAINANFLTQLGKEKAQTLEVNCVTCHHGQSRPQLLEDILFSETMKTGVGGASQKYRELRTRHYGGFTYDFGERTLMRLAEHLLREKQVDDAVAILSLNLEYYSESAGTYYALAEAYAAKNEVEKAIGYFEKSLQLEPNNRRAKQRLEQLSNR